MSKIDQNIDTGRVTSWEDLRRFVTYILVQIQNVINGQIEFGVNIKSNLLDANFIVANQELAIQHGLRQIPKGYFLSGSNVATSIYDGDSNWTETNIYLKSSVVANTRITVF